MLSCFVRKQAADHFTGEIERGNAAEERRQARRGMKLLDGRAGKDPAAYVCHDHVCALPATTVDALVDQLG